MLFSKNSELVLMHWIVQASIWIMSWIKQLKFILNTKIFISLTVELAEIFFQFVARALMWEQRDNWTVTNYLFSEIAINKVPFVQWERTLNNFIRESDQESCLITANIDGFIARELAWLSWLAFTESTDQWQHYVSNRQNSYVYYFYIWWILLVSSSLQLSISNKYREL